MDTIHQALIPTVYAQDNTQSNTSQSSVTSNQSAPEILGIKCGAQELMNNTCSWAINKTLGIRKSDPTPNPTGLLQDITLAATSFMGTILMIGIVYLGFQAVMKGGSDSSAMGEIKTKIKNLAIGFLLVIGSYTIIRLIQYIAKGV